MFLRGMPHLTYDMKRPKGFKKEFIIEDSPNFNEISKEHPLPTAERQINVQHIFDLLHCQSSSIINTNTHGSLPVQPATPLLRSAMYHNICLRQQWLKQQLLLNNARHAHIIIEKRNRNLAEQILYANAMNQMQNKAHS